MENQDPMKLLWTWPDTPIKIGTILLISVVLQVVVNVSVQALRTSITRRAAAHRDSKPTRADRLAAATGLRVERSRQRGDTLGSLLRSVATFMIWTVALITLLAAVGIPTAPLLTSAGVGGIALAFGAQSLVKDCLSGMFMLIEDQYGVGDFVTIGTVTGTVEEVSLRSTRIRDAMGMVWYVPNGEIKSVGNHSQGWTSSIIDIPVNYDEDPVQVKQVLTDMVTGLDLDEEWAAPLLEPPTVLGVGSLSPGKLTMQILAKCEPNQQWGVQRELRARAKDALDDAGIRGPVAFGE